MGSTANRRRRLPRWARITLFVAGGVLVLPVVLLAGLAWALDLGGMVRGRVMAEKPAWERAIGRPIAVGAVEVKIFPTLAAEVHDVALGPAPGQTGPAAEPLLQVSSVRVGIATWPLLRSLGKEVAIRYVEARGPRATVVRLSDGKLSYQDLLDRLAASPQAEGEKADGAAQPPLDLRHVRLSRVAITAASIRFHDLSAPSGPTELAIDRLDLVAEDVGVGVPITIRLDAAVLPTPGDPEPNLHFAAVLAPLPADLRVEPGLSLVRHVELRLRPLEVEPLLRFLPSTEGASLRRGRVSADLAVDIPEGAGTLRLSGRAAAEKLTLATSAKGGPSGLGVPADVALRVDVIADPIAGHLEAKALEIRVNEMSVSGSADLRTMWTTPTVRALALRSENVTLERLLALLPEARRPRGMVLRGPVDLRASASGSPTDAEVNAALDLGAATLVLPQLDKPAGTPLSVELRAQIRKEGIAVRALGGKLGPLSLMARGTVRSPEDFDLQVDTGPVDLDPLLRLLPQVRKAIPDGMKLGGRVDVKGGVRGKGKKLDASAHIAMRDADATTPDLTLTGAADLQATLRIDGRSRAVEGDLDLTPARIRVPGAIDKAAGVPMTLKLGLDQAERKIVIKNARMILPGGSVQAMGEADLAGHRMDVSVPLTDLDLSRLSEAVPALRKGALPPALAQARVKFALAIDGDPGKPETVRVRVENLDLTAPGSRLHGRVEVLGLDSPRKISFDLRGEDVDLDSLLGADKKPAATAEPQPPTAPAPRAAGGGAPAIPKSLRQLDLDGKLKVARARYQGVDLRDVDAVVTLEKGRLSLGTFRAGAFGGTVSASGTTVDLGRDPAPFALRARLDRIHLPELFAARSPELARALEGRGTVDLQVNGAGLTFAEAAPRLDGRIDLALTDGALKSASLSTQAIQPLVDRVPGLAGGARARRDEMALRDLSAHFAVAGGALRTSQPIRFATDQGALTLSGTIGLDQRLALSGTIEVAPQVIETVSQGHLKPAGPVPLDLRFTGTLTAPEIVLDNPARTVAALAAAYLRGSGRGALNQALGGRLGGPAGNVLDQVLQSPDLGGRAVGAPAQAPPAQDPEQQRLAEQQRRNQEEAQRRQQQDAQRRMQQDAQRQLGDGLRNLFGGGGR